jgi:hypothetical protein
MLRRLLAAWVLVGMASGWAAEISATSTTLAPVTSPSAPEPERETEKSSRPLLPLHLPGYDLRVLDTKKQLLFNVAGTWVVVSVPVFFYIATPAHDDGVKRLRQVTEDLRQLIRQPGWSSAEFAHLQAELETAAAQLVQP